jgi:hypothetical protein
MPWSCWFDGNHYWFYINGTCWVWLEERWQEVKMVVANEGDSLLGAVSQL